MTAPSPEATEVTGATGVEPVEARAGMEVDAEVHALLPLFARWGHDVQAVQRAPLGWRIVLGGAPPMAWVRHRGSYWVEGPHEALARAGLGLPVADRVHFVGRLRRVAGEDVKRFELGRYPGNAEGRHITGQLVLASIATTCARELYGWADSTRFGGGEVVLMAGWALIGVGLFRGSDVVRAFALSLYPLVGLFALFAMPFEDTPLGAGLQALVALVHIVGFGVLLRSRPVREHFGMWC